MRSNIAHAYPGVGNERQYAIKFDCERSGCDPEHVENGKVWICEDLTEASSTARAGIGGHPVELVTRVVVYPEWEDVRDPEDHA